jgi:hypothetical protein
MTYCCGTLVREGLAMIADTRTNAGIDRPSAEHRSGNGKAVPPKVRLPQEESGEGSCGDEACQDVVVPCGNFASEAEGVSTGGVRGRAFVAKRPEPALKIELVLAEPGDIDECLGPGQHCPQTQQQHLVARIKHFAALAWVLQFFETTQKNKGFADCLLRCGARPSGNGDGIMSERRNGARVKTRFFRPSTSPLPCMAPTPRNLPRANLRCIDFDHSGVSSSGIQRTHLII